MATTTKKENETVIKEERVKITLPISVHEQDDVFVGINGKGYQIKRGVEVEVPLSVKEVLDNSDRMRMEAFERSKRLQEGN